MYIPVCREFDRVFDEGPTLLTSGYVTMVGSVSRREGCCVAEVVIDDVIEVG